MLEMIGNAPAERIEAERLAAAAAVARRRGHLQDPEAVRRLHISPGGLTCVLLDGEARPIARLPLAEVERQMRQRQRRLRRLITPLQRRGRGEATAWRSLLRLQPRQHRALVWAFSSHRPVPPVVFDWEALLITAVLLLLGLLPGLLYLVVLLRARRQANREMEALVQRWNLQARPDPSEDGVRVVLAAAPATPPRPA